MYSKGISKFISDNRPAAVVYSKEDVLSFLARKGWNVYDHPLADERGKRPSHALAFIKGEPEKKGGLFGGVIPPKGFILYSIPRVEWNSRVTPEGVTYRPFWSDGGTFAAEERVSKLLKEQLPEEVTISFEEEIVELPVPDWVLAWAIYDDPGVMTGGIRCYRREVADFIRPFQQQLDELLQ